ncbi:Glycine cleavage system H protein 2 mitochondrial [Zea mays]|uniref:Glycine cleavage system H protein 2 mitochondrial n=1 Tax=Zea mays TaxID=4577 RepID=A0A1D6HUY3_MAIZE|nr:Glycine cleavage system H protein 2 mitochondrial [Zea mays]
MPSVLWVSLFMWSYQKLASVYPRERPLLLLRVSGEVVEVDEKLSDLPGLVNTSPYEKGWLIKVKLSNSGELNSLMDDDKYSKFCEGNH